MSETLTRKAIAIRKTKTVARPVEVSVQAGRTEGGRTVVLRIKDGSQDLVYLIPLSEWGRLNRDAIGVP